jgi:hypothetical protein
LDWSIGEVQTETFAASSNILSEGFHQCSNLISDIERNLALNLDISIYPNPVADCINLKIDNKIINGILFTIADFEGKVLQTGKIYENLTRIDFSSYANGYYLVSIKQNNQLLKSFKIIKN